MNAVFSLKYKVRRGYRGDAWAVREIFFSALREHGFAVIAENLNAEIADFGLGKNPVQDDFVAISGGKVCGFLILLRDSEVCGELSKVFVARSHRGLGIGTMLIERCIQTAIERDYRELILETHTAFREARRYYERHGWTLAPHWPEEVSPTRKYLMTLHGYRPWRSRATDPR
jgi:GNAT superfamily N-acetyltransferase